MAKTKTTKTTKTAKTVQRRRSLGRFVERVTLKNGPPEVATVKTAHLLALGLPTICIGGEVIETVPLDNGSDRSTALVTFSLLGMTYSVGYEVGVNPFGTAETVELTVLEERDGELMQAA